MKYLVSRKASYVCMLYIQLLPRSFCSQLGKNSLMHRAPHTVCGECSPFSMQKSAQFAHTLEVLHSRWHRGDPLHQSITHHPTINSRLLLLLWTHLVPCSAHCGSCPWFECEYLVLCLPEGKGEQATSHLNLRQKKRGNEGRSTTIGVRGVSGMIAHLPLAGVGWVG